MGTDPAWVGWRAVLGAAGWDVVSPEAAGSVDAVLVSPWDADVHEAVDAARRRWVWADVWCVATGASARMQRVALVHGAAGILPREASAAAARRVAVVASGPRLQPSPDDPAVTALATARPAARRQPHGRDGGERAPEAPRQQQRPRAFHGAVAAAGVRPDGCPSDRKPRPGLRWGARSAVESDGSTRVRSSMVTPPARAPWTVRQTVSSAWWQWPPAAPNTHHAPMLDLAVVAVGGSDGQPALRRWAERRRIRWLEVHLLAHSSPGTPNGTEACDRIAVPPNCRTEAVVETVRMWRERRAGAVCAYVAAVRPPAGGQPDPRLRTLRDWRCGAVAVVLSADLASLHAAAGLVGHLAVRRPGEGPPPPVAAWILGGAAQLGTSAELQAALNAPCLVVD